MPYKITFSSTYSCNSKCNICGIWKLYRDNPHLKANELSTKEIDEFFKNLGSSLFWLSLTGGEPILRDDFNEIVGSAIKNLSNLSIISVNTNGLATEKIITKIEKIVSENPETTLIVAVSLDYAEKEYNEIRGIPNAYKIAGITLEKLVTMKKKYKNLQVNREIIIGDYNIKKTEIVSNKDARTRGYSNIFAFIDNAKYYRNDSELIQRKMDYLPTIDELIRKTKIMTIQDVIVKIFYRLSKEYFTKPGQPLSCHSSWASVFVDPYGNVKPCIMMDPVGNIRDTDFDLRGILQKPEFKEVQGRIKKGECPHCWTPCEAFQTIIQNLPGSITEIIK
jgi:Fe-coproporphyrin III synthase